MITGNFLVDRWHLERGGNVAIPVMGTGGFRISSAMGRAIEEGQVDMIGLARPFCTDIDIAERLLCGEVSEIKDWQEKIRIGRGLLSPTSPSVFCVT